MDVVMPQLGETVAAGRITTWFKRPGERVAAGETLFEIETDKATVEVPAVNGGVLAEILVPEGATAPVNAVVAVIAEDGAPLAATTKTAPDPFAAVRTPTRGYGRARTAGGAALSPRQRRRAAAYGPDAAGADGVHRAPLNRIRQVTAERLARSWREIPHVLQAVEVDFARIEQLRADRKAAFRARTGAGLTPLAFVARAACLALGEFPQVNASLDGDALILHRDVHLGIAVDLDRDGLLVAVIRDAERRSVAELAVAIADVSQRARSGRLDPRETTGSTYTLSNSGTFGTLITAPIINPPEVAILSIDGVRKRPVVIDGAAGDAIAIRPVGVLAQSFDHRAFDGAYSAAFLARLRALLESRDWSGELG